MQVINRKGELFNVDGDEVPDGCGISTSMMLMDGLDDTQREIARSYSRPVHFTDALGRANQPGHRFINSGELHDVADAAEEREIRKRKISDAWRTTGASYLGQPEPDDAPDDKTQSETDARELRKAQISSAWRTPGINPADPKARVFEKNFAASYAPYMKADAATDGVDARDAAFAALVARSESAWRTP